MALEVLGYLNDSRYKAPQGLRLTDIANHLHIEHRHATGVLDALNELGWVGRLEQADAKVESAWVLLVDLTETPLAPLVAKLWLAAPSDDSQLLWDRTQLASLKVADVIKT